ncbi:MAG: hypothetical protein M1438_02440 [Deltaproteobacteria bacterium]|nr:hypothetical protein [Deltaproteobacteria bacterium]
MASSTDDDERERPSWREIDQRRDRAGGQRPQRQPKLPKKQAEKLRLQALAQAEALFKGKRAKPEYQTALRKLEEKHGAKQFAAYAKKFLEEYGLPEEWGALTRLLDYQEPSVLQEVLQAMAAQLNSRSRIELQGFKGRLQVLSLTSAFPEVRRCAEEILSGF